MTGGTRALRRALTAAVAAATCATTIAAVHVAAPTANADTPGATWTQMPVSSGPSGRYNPNSAFHLPSGKTVLFGGRSPGGVRFGSTWTWDGAAWTSASPANSPSARDSVPMAYDDARGTVVLFGGWNGSSHLGDTWTWDGVDWTRHFPATSPPNRYGAGMAFDATLGQVILFGGWNGWSYLNDTWAWNGVTWTQLNPATIPPGREAMVLETDLTGRPVLFGGNAAGALGDTWTWNGVTWTQQSPATSPPARGWPSAATDALGRVVVFGGTDNGDKNDTWSWDGRTWTQRTTTTAPAPRSDAAMARDPHGRIVLFGGSGYGDTWTFTDTTPPSATLPPTPTVPPLPPTPTVPPLPSGTGFPSDECAGGTVVADGFVDGGYVRVRIAQPSSQTRWVCVRAETATLRYGGKFVVSAPGASTGPPPTNDTSADACTTTAGNTLPGPHPLFGGAVGDPNDPPYLPFVVDAYRDANAVWVCAGVGSVRHRVVVPVSVGVTPPSVTFLPDAPGTDTDVATAPATPSGTCQAGGGTRHADVVNAAGRSFLYTWSPSPGVVRVCVRTSGPATAGGVLTVDTSNATGALPSVSTGSDVTPCGTQVLTLVNPPVTVRRSSGTGTPASVCLSANGGNVRVTVATGNGQAPAAVSWQPDPGTP